MIKQFAMFMFPLLLVLGFFAPLLVFTPQTSAAGGCFRQNPFEQDELFQDTCPDSDEIAEIIADNRCVELLNQSGTSIREFDCPGGTTADPIANNDECDANSFFGLPQWYKYLDSQKSVDPLTGAETCDVELNNIASVLLIAAAVIEIMLRVASLVTLGFIVYGGVLYIVSQSQPEKTSQALKTVLNAIIGLVITIAAAALVSFIAGSFN
jgi:hypothetical protein